MSFTRKQHTLFANRDHPQKNAVFVQCSVSVPVYQFARNEQEKFAGKGRDATPTLADIYHDLALEGAELALSDLITPAYLHKSPGGCPAQIKFESAFNTGSDLIERCQRLANDASIYQFTLPETAVTLMETAIAWRAKNAAAMAQTV